MSTEGGAVFTFSLTGGAVCPLAPRQLRYCVLLYCCACLYHSLVVVQPSLTTVPCPTTKFTLIISKSFVGIKQRMISVALKTPLKTRLGMCIYKTSLPHRPGDYIGFTSSCPPHILQQNCAHERNHRSRMYLHLLLFYALRVSSREPFHASFSKGGILI